MRFLPAGFARLGKVDGQAHLEQLSVHPDAAGAGLGRAGFEVVPKPDGELAELREHETSLGLDALGQRVAMRAPLRRQRAGPAFRSRH